MITPASRKAKGRKAQQQVRDSILARFPDLLLSDFLDFMKDMT